MLIDRIEQWNQVEAMVNVAWGSQQNIAMMMEIYRHALATFSIGGTDDITKRQHNDVIRKLVKSHQTLFMVRCWCSASAIAYVLDPFCRSRLS